MKMLKKDVCYVILKTVEDFGISNGEQYTIVEGVINTKERAEQVLEFLVNNEYNRLVAEGKRPCKEVKSSNKIIIGVGIIGGYDMIYEIHKTYNWD